MSKVKEFKTELKNLYTKYDFEVKEHDQYNGMEEYCGTTKYLKHKDEENPYYSESIAEIIEEIFGDIGKP